MIRPLRVWRNHYICLHCDTEFADEMLTQSESFCPACDAECQAYAHETLFVDVEVEDEEETV